MASRNEIDNMKITIVNSLYHPYQMGGAEKSTQLLAEGIASRGHEVSVITLHPKNVIERSTVNGVQVNYIPLANIYWPFDKHKDHSAVERFMWHVKNVWNSKTAATAGSVLDEIKPDVVHVNVPMGFSAALLSEVLSRRIRLVQTLRDYTYVCERASMFRGDHNCEKQCWDCRIFTSQYKRLSHRLSAVVSNSQFVLDAHLQNGYFKGVPGHVIFNIASVDGNAVPRLIPPLETHSLVFGFLGQIIKSKGLDIVLEATTRLTRNNWSLKIAGTGPAEYLSELKRRYTDRRIEWLGFIEPKRFFEQIDTALVPSVWNEPLPRSMIEAFSAGRSVIASRVGGNLEVARLGKTFEVYDAENAAELSRLMDAASADVLKWREGGFSSAESAAIFSEPAVVQRYCEVYQDG